MFPEEGEKVVFFNQDPTKTQDTSKSTEPLYLFAFDEDPLLCPVKCLSTNVARTKELRDQVHMYLSACHMYS